MSTESGQAIDFKGDSEGAHKTITIIVEVNGKENEVKFDHSPVTGAEIREKAGVPPTDDLTRLVHGKPTGGNIALSDLVAIKDGEHFLAAPGGVVS